MQLKNFILISGSLLLSAHLARCKSPQRNIAADCHLNQRSAAGGIGQVKVMFAIGVVLVGMQLANAANCIAPASTAEEMASGSVSQSLAENTKILMAKAKKNVDATAATGGQTASVTAAAQPQAAATKSSSTVEVDAKAPAEIVFTATDKKDFSNLEATIKKHLGGFYEIGKALFLIQQRNLQKINDAKLSFEGYADHLGIGKAHAYREINAYKCVTHLKATLGPNGVTAFPSNEAQVRPLTKLEPADQVTAWSTVLQKANGGTITATMVDEAVNALNGNGSSTTEKAAGAADEKNAKALAKADHRKLVTISKLVAKANEIEPAKLSVEKLKTIIDKIAALLSEPES